MPASTPSSNRPVRRRRSAGGDPRRPSPQPAGGGPTARLLRDLKAANDAVREKAFREAMRAAGGDPGALLPHWTEIAGLLRSGNAFHRAIAVQLLPQIAAADAGARLRKMSGAYWAMLDDPSVMVARYTARAIPTLVANVPSLERAATTRLLDIERTHHQGTRLELVKADAVAALSALYPTSGRQRGIRRFVDAQADSPSGTTRKAVKEFHSRHGR